MPGYDGEVVSGYEGISIRVYESRAGTYFATATQKSGVPRADFLKSGLLQYTSYAIRTVCKMAMVTRLAVASDAIVAVSDVIVAGLVTP